MHGLLAAAPLTRWPDEGSIVDVQVAMTNEDLRALSGELTRAPMFQELCCFVRDLIAIT